MYIDLHEGIIAIFAEAQRFSHDERARREWYWLEQRRARAAAEAMPSRRAYKTAWQADSDDRTIEARLRAGERPAHWGKRWRAAAARLGIEVPPTWYERRASRTRRRYVMVMRKRRSSHA